MNKLSYLNFSVILYIEKRSKKIDRRTTIVKKLGSKIRRLRNEKKITLKELARRTGLTSSYLSQIEKGLLIPSLNALIKISKCLEVPLLSFFLEKELNNGIVVRAKDRKKIKLPNSYVVYQLLTPDTKRRIGHLLAEIEPGEGEDEEKVTHEGDESIYVLEGTLKVEVGDESYILEKGDSIYFSSVIPHRIINIGKSKVVYIAAEVPPSF